MTWSQTWPWQAPSQLPGSGEDMPSRLLKMSFMRDTVSCLGDWLTMTLKLDGSASVPYRVSGLPSQGLGPCIRRCFCADGEEEFVGNIGGWRGRVSPDASYSHFYKRFPRVSSLNPPASSMPCPRSHCIMQGVRKAWKWAVWLLCPCMWPLCWTGCHQSPLTGVDEWVPRGCPATIGAFKKLSQEHRVRFCLMQKSLMYHHWTILHCGYATAYIIVRYKMSHKWQIKLGNKTKTA